MGFFGLGSSSKYSTPRNTPTRSHASRNSHHSKPEYDEMVAHLNLTDREVEPSDSVTMVGSRASSRRAKGFRRRGEYRDAATRISSSGLPELSERNLAEIHQKTQFQSDNDAGATMVGRPPPASGTVVSFSPQEHAVRRTQPLNMDEAIALAKANPLSVQQYAPPTGRGGIMLATPSWSSARREMEQQRIYAESYADSTYGSATGSVISRSSKKSGRSYLSSTASRRSARDRLQPLSIDEGYEDSVAYSEQSRGRTHYR